MAINFGPYTREVRTKADRTILNRVVETIDNIARSRSKLFDKFFGDPRRSLEAECGYPERIDTDKLWNMWKRSPFAQRVVSIYPIESWKSPPYIYEDESPDVTTEFERAFVELNKKLRADSWYEAEDGFGSPVFEALFRADVQSGIGSFGVLLIGLSDGKELSQPADGLDNSGKYVEKTYADGKRPELLYLKPYSEIFVNITQWETNPTNPRYGLPVMYQIQTADLDATTKVGNGVEPTKTIDVHWTRILHITDNRVSSDIHGTPRQEPVFEQLLDLRKLLGGSAEMYWRGAFPGISFETHPALNPMDIDIEVAELKEKADAYMNGLSRYLWTAGMTAKSMAPQVVDPSPQIDRQIDAICIQIGVPKRKFIGSERGELASSDDADSWQDKIQGRKRLYLIPHIVIPFVDRMIALGVLPRPKDKYRIFWPGTDTLSEKEQANIAETRTRTLGLYTSTGLDKILAPKDFLAQEMGYKPDQIKLFMDNLKTYTKEKEAHDLERMKKMQEMQAPADDAKNPGFSKGAAQPTQQLADSVKPSEGPASREGQRQQTKDKNGTQPRTRK